jgi:hypothetical protein
MGKSIYTEIGEQQYNKKQFAERWKSITSSYETGVFFNEEDTLFMRQVCLKIERFRKIVLRPGQCKFKLTSKEFNGRKVKGVVLMTPSSKYEVWVGKSYVMSKIFPRTYAPDPAKENRKLAIRALRNIIQPQIDLYKRRVSGRSVVKSSLTGKPIHGAYHVDHVYPFIRLVEEWCRDNSLDLETIPVKCVGVTCRLSCIKMSESWFDYHALNAQYQVLDPRENIIKGAKYYGKSSDNI